MGKWDALPLHPRAARWDRRQRVGSWMNKLSGYDADVRRLKTRKSALIKFANAGRASALPDD